MKKKATSKTNKTPTTQLARFKEAARELGCDDDPKAFEKRVAKIAKAKPDASKSSQRH